MYIQGDWVIPSSFIMNINPLPLRLMIILIREGLGTTIPTVPYTKQGSFSLSLLLSNAIDFYLINRCHVTCYAQLLERCLATRLDVVSLTCAIKSKSPVENENIAQISSAILGKDFQIWMKSFMNIIHNFFDHCCQLVDIIYVGS